MLCRAFAAAAVCCVLSASAFGYALTGTRWTSPNATFQLQLGSSAPLADGSPSWGASAEDALSVWNSHLGTFRFNVVRDSTAAKAPNNRVNNVHFSSSINGQSWGSGVLAVTITYSSGTSQVESDVLFNSSLQWDSYRGQLRRDTSGRSVYDFHRVAMHEFGHALGLDHPDEAGQAVAALMNSRVSSLDTVTADDIAGAQLLYPAVSAVPLPPEITSQPTSRTVAMGQSTTLNVVASSTTTLAYQWRKDGVNIVGAITSSYTISSATAAHNGSYTVNVSNIAGMASSNPAIVTVTQTATPTNQPVTPGGSPVITARPLDRTVATGASFALSVGASGAGLSYQWFKDGNPLPGAASPVYTVASATLAHAGNYHVIVSNTSGSASSPPCRVTVGDLPVFASEPASQTIASGARLTLAVTTTGTPAPAFQWFKAGSAVAGATSSTYSIANAQAPDAGVYHVDATNAFGTRTSASATITVQALPRIVEPPLAQTVSVGTRVQLSVNVAASTPPPNFQWLRDGKDIAGATTANLIFATARASDNGSYSVRVSNAAGSVTSAAAVLTVQYSRLVNLSTRAFVPAGGNLTPGFVIRGAGSKPLVIRAVGPTLAAFGVGTALSATRLDLIAQGSNAPVASNADWGGGSALQNAFARVGAFPLAANSKDAALQAALAPNGYTVRIAGSTAEMAGITLAEIYDDDMSASSPELINLSTLGFVGTGENALTAGFVISGNAQKRVLIRAIGPGLAAFGVGDPLSDPQLGLVPFGASETLASNDDWPDVADLHNAFRNAGAFPLQTGSRDSALVITLHPGAYTVVISSIDGRSTGTALVEIYDLDP